jgi:uncharacterized iron-regulated membrane protein
MAMRAVHRFVAVFAVVFGLYIGGTGTWLQLIDLQTLLSHAPATDPDLQAIREGHDGPPNFQVLVDADYSAAPLPADLNYDGTLTTVLKSARTASGAAFSFVELRMLDGKPVAQISAGGQLLRFDAVSGAVLLGPDNAPAVGLPPRNRPSFRGTLKNIHRMNAYGDYATIVELIAGVALCVMLITGLLMYFRLLGARANAGRRGLFWYAGGWWRTLHRMIAVSAGTFLLVVAFSGLLLAVGSLGVSAYRVMHNGVRAGLTADVSSPLSDAELPGILRTTLTAYKGVSPGSPIKVIRLRYFASMQQGIVVGGSDADTRQLAFNTTTGRKAKLYETGYPVTGQPFGWEEDQIAKQIHRGDFIGMSGRWMSLFAGLSMLFLSLSGAVMYCDMWRAWRRAGMRH